MHDQNTVSDAYTSNSYRKFGASTAPSGTLEHTELNGSGSCDCGVPVQAKEDSETGTPEHRTRVALFVSTDLQSWKTDQPHAFARDVQINDTAYRRLDPEYYAWLRSKMNLAKMATDAGQFGRDAFNELRGKFNAVHQWAIDQLGEAALLEAVRTLDARDYVPPVPEPDRPCHVSRPADTALADAVAKVDVIRDRALALGWTQDSLYGTGGSSRFTLGHERGLVCYLRPDDRIGEVTTHSIEIILVNNVRQRFYNPNVDQPWIRRVR
ncbi:MAG: hypothetical protein IT165_22695 [Bryobacterales bacterium]|nr:hypothetical protein [Bryobacterales bacterium]